MIDRFLIRTVKHIHRVQNNMVILCTEYRKELDLSDHDVRDLMHNIMQHDQSKFNYIQFFPYAELTEYYHQKRLGLKYEYSSQEMKERVKEAIQDHYKQEFHHPEDTNSKHYEWDKVNILDCACDLQAMAQEFNEGSFRKYYEEKWLTEHESSFIPRNFIYVKKWMEKSLICFEKKLINKDN